MNVLETLWNDLRYALRQFRLNPGFALPAIVSLALAIGVNTAVSSCSTPSSCARSPWRTPTS